MEQKGMKRQRLSTSFEKSSNLDDTRTSEDEPASKCKARNWEEELKMIKKKKEESYGIRSKMPKKGENGVFPIERADIQPMSA